MSLPAAAPSLVCGEEPPRIETPIPGPRSRKLAERLRRVESPDTTFFSPDFPIFWASALGSNVIDVDGNVYIDFNAGFGVASIGHSHPRVTEAIGRQTQTLIHAMGDVHPTQLRLELAERIVRFAPGSDDWKVIFGVTGSDSVEAALKTAAIATGRPGLVAFRGGYHGITLGALGATAWPKFHRGLEDIMGRQAVIFPYPGPRRGSGEGVLDRIRRFLESSEGRRARIGAVLIEPILGRGGTVIPPDGFLPGLRSLCDEFGLVLIFDEIYTGFGRTGDWLACRHEGVAPDLITAGKALGGGLPISVCMGRKRIIDAWGESTGEARHTSTFLGHPLACAAALATLQVLEDDHLAAASREKGALLRKLLTDAIGDHRSVSAIRGRGLMVGIEIVDPISGQPDPATAWSVIVESLKRGVILLVSGMEGHVISLTPPLTITESQLRCGVDVLRQALTDCGPR